jgi:hypothetical protein
LHQGRFRKGSRIWLACLRRLRLATWGVSVSLVAWEKERKANADSVIYPVRCLRQLTRPAATYPVRLSFAGPRKRAQALWENRRIMVTTYRPSPRKAKTTRTRPRPERQARARARGHRRSARRFRIAVRSWRTRKASSCGLNCTGPCPTIPRVRPGRRAFAFVIFQKERAEARREDEHHEHRPQNLAKPKQDARHDHARQVLSAREIACLNVTDLATRRH